MTCLVMLQFMFVYCDVFLIKTQIYRSYTARSHLGNFICQLISFHFVLCKHLFRLIIKPFCTDLVFSTSPLIFWKKVYFTTSNIQNTHITILQQITLFNTSTSIIVPSSFIHTLFKQTVQHKRLVVDTSFGHTSIIN